MKISRSLYGGILSHFSPAPPEQGGILGMKNGVVCEYIHDRMPGSEDAAVYFPSVAFFNDCILAWRERGIEFGGIVHSHPCGQDGLSGTDIEYIRLLYKENPRLEKTFFPLILNGCDMIVYEAELTDSQPRITLDTIEFCAE